MLTTRRPYQFIILALLLIIISVPAALQAASFHTISIDGSNDFAADEDFSTSSGGYDAHATWDASNLYLGYTGSDVQSTSADEKWIIWYIDTDPQCNPITGNGTTDALGFRTQDWTLPFNADYMLQARANGNLQQIQYWDGASWQSGTFSGNIGNDDATTFMEILLPLSDIGSPTQIRILGYFVDETEFAEWTYASWPDTALDGGDGYKSPGNFSHWYGYNLIDGIAPNSGQNYDRQLATGVVTNADTGAGFCTIQTAVDDDSTQAGHTLNIAAGTFNENVFVDKSLTLRGAGDGSDSATNTILDGTSLTGIGIRLNNNVTDVTIEDMRIVNYSGTNQSSGIYGNAGNNNLIVQNVTANGNGPGFISASGGVMIHGPVDNVLIDHVTAHDNTGRGIVIWGGHKTNITITNNDAQRNNCCGIELQDGTASGVIMSNNTVIDNSDSGMSAIGLMGGAGPNVIANNIVTNNGRFGIEIKNPNGSGLDTGDGSIVVEGNNVSFAASGSMNVRDHAGIAAFRRSFTPGNPEGYVDIPTGVVIRNNTVSGYQQQNAAAISSEGFGIVIEGRNHTVTGNTVQNNDIGIQEQGGLHPNANYVPNDVGDGDQDDGQSPLYFGRGNAPSACGNTIIPNTVSGNGLDTRQSVINGSGGLVTNTDTAEIFCTIQDAIDDTDTDAGDTIQLEAATYTELVDITKSVVLQGLVGTIIQPSENVPDFTSNHSGSILWIQADDVVIRDLEIDGDNPSISGGHAYGGADINAVRGIYINNGSAFNNSLIENVTFRNLGRGTNLYGGQNHIIQNNIAQNMGGPNDGNYGYGILLMYNSSAQIIGNQVDDALVAGVFMQLNNSTTDSLIANNTVTDSGIGLGWNGLSGGINGVVENNTSTNVDLGMQVTSITNGNLEVRNNSFTMPTGNGEQGFYVWNTAPDAVLIVDNTLSGGDEGVALFDDSPDFGLAQAHLRLADNTIQNTETAVTITSNSITNTISLRATGNDIQNATTGVSYNGTEIIDSVTIAGNTFDNITTVFDVATTGSLFAYANNITTFTTGVNNTSGALNANHNWWGAITPTGVNDTNAYDFRLGAPVNTWVDGTGMVSLADSIAGGNASFSGAGTLVIVNHGNGLANAPFGKGIPADTGAAQCADFYDFFAISNSGSYNVSIPVDGTNCPAGTIDDKLFEFALNASNAPDLTCAPDTACWNAIPATRAGDVLTSNVTAAEVEGTPFAAPSVNNNDPTAVSLAAFSASANSVWLITAVLLLLLSITGLVTWKRRTH